MNNIINIIDRDFNFLGQIDNYESLIMTKKWHGIGSFELHLHEDTTHAEQLQKENIVFTRPNKAYVILHREINSIDGKLIVKGLELKSYLARWLVFPPEEQAYYRVNSNVETIMKEYVQATLDRKSIISIVVAFNQNRGIKTVYQSRYKNLADELEKLSLASGLGWDIVLDLDNKQFVFEVYEGQNRTANQSILPPAIFSIEYDNIAEQTLIDSRLNYANIAIVAGQGEGVDRKIEIVGDIDKGLDSFEIFVDARDIENEEELSVRGRQKLAEVQEIFSFDSRISVDKNLIYEKDFELGDIVTIQNKKWNATADRRITEVTEIYESDGFKLDIVFGESIPTIKDVIKQATDAPVAEGSSKGEPGEPGKDGKDGVGLQFTWDGTSLGVKREDETEYQFINLQGPKGEQGEQGPPGKSLEFHWNGTQLGVRVEGQTQYQYVDLKGSQGERGPRGFSLEYDWQGTQLGIKREDESNYQYVDLRGPKGDKGDPGSDANVTYENVTNALGYTPVNKAGDTMTGDLKVNEDIVAGKELVVGYNGTTESLQRHKWKYNGSTGYLELWRYTNQNKWELSATFPNRNTGEGGLVVEGKQMATEDYVNNKVKTDVPANAKFTDTITTINGKTGAISKADIVALGIPAQDTTYSEISEAEIDIGTSSTKRVITGRRVKYILDKVQDWINSLTKADIGLDNVDNIKQATKVEFDTHNNDSTRHITSDERNKWNNKANKSDIPTKVSQLENDENYVTQEELENVDEKLLLKADKDYVDTQLTAKVDKVAGKGLSTNDYTDEEKQKNQDNADNISNLQQELTAHKADTVKHITTAERASWNSKQDALGYTPVNKAGDTMTGSLILTGSIFDTEFKADNWNLINKYTGGGWARGLLNVKNKDGTNYIQIGGFGSGQNFTRLYIGKAWNDWLLGINPNNNTVEIQGNLTKNGKEVATKEDIPTEIDGGTKIITSPTEPEGLATGDQWHKEY